MTYLQFLGMFLLPPIVLLLLVERRRLRPSLGWQLAVVVVLAVVYTAPWDRVLIVQRVWSYPAGQVLGRTLLRVPLEEYAFYVLQVVLAGLVTAAVWRRWEARR